MSNSWIPNQDENSEVSPEFDLFASNTDDNLHEVLAKGAYKWTNKFTAIFAAVLVIVTSVSGGIWYGHRSANSGTSISGVSGLSGFSRSGFSRGGGNSASSGASGSGAAAFAGGGFGGSRVSGTVTSVKGNTITVTADSDPSTTVKSGDSVSVRVSGGGQGSSQPGATTPSTSTPSSGTKTGGKKSASNNSSATNPTAAPTGAPAAGGRSGGGGGITSNPEFVACLKKNGVTVTAGQRLDRTDPKVSAALQACFQTLGVPAGNGGGGNGGGFGARPSGAPAPVSTTNP